MNWYVTFANVILSLSDNGYDELFVSNSPFINVPFVEAVFDDDYESILGEKLVDGEVPDGIIIRLSEGLYNNYPSKLDSNQQAIIKVLSAYICIQN